MRGPIVVLDTETTGISAATDRMVEIAGVEVTGDRRDFQSLINPKRDIPFEAMAIHHITPDMVEEAPLAKEAVDNLIEFFAPKYFVAHNAKFDKGFVAPLLNVVTAPAWICTMRCAQQMYPSAPSYKNQVLRYYLGLKVETPLGLVAHRALYDCYVTRAIFERMLSDGISLDQMLNWSNGPTNLVKIPFGKYKGTKFSEVETGWLTWALKQDNMDPDVLYAARQELNRRKGNIL